jgi:hypothetical protein
MAKLVFSAGGAFYRPNHPHLFTPGLYAAAHYLKAVEEVDPEVRRKLAEEVFGKHEFPRHFPHWQGVGLFPTRVTFQPIPGLPPGPQRQRFEEAKPFFKALRLWTNESYMWSPLVLDLVYRTMELWERIGGITRSCGLGEGGRAAYPSS